MDKQARVKASEIFLHKKEDFMSLRVRRIKKAFGFDETKTQKYVLVPDRATVVNFEHLCEQVSEVAGVNMGMVQITLYGLVKSLKTFIRQGHAVQVDGFGTFIPSFNAKSSEVEQEANVDSIYHVKLRFLPSTELREVMQKIEFEFDVKDSTNDTQANTGTGGGSEEGSGEEEEERPGGL